jgi:hypothetical protein
MMLGVPTGHSDAAVKECPSCIYGDDGASGQICTCPPIDARGVNTTERADPDAAG